MAYEMDESSDVAKEIMQEQVEHHQQSDPWVDRVALSAMIMALFTALSGLFAGITANALVVERTQEILVVEKLEAERLTIQILRSKHELLSALEHKPDEKEVELIKKYEKNIKKFAQQLIQEEGEVRHTLHEHEMFAIAVTVLSVAITLSGIALVSRGKTMWKIGLAFGFAGISLFLLPIFEMLTA